LLVLLASATKLPLARRLLYRVAGKQELATMSTYANPDMKSSLLRPLSVLLRGSPAIAIRLRLSAAIDALPPQQRLSDKEERHEARYYRLKLGKESLLKITPVY
jgi:hypothetical protein